MEEYKDNEKAFIYLDPPYLNSFNKNYKNSKNSKIDDENIIIDSVFLV